MKRMIALLTAATLGLTALYAQAQAVEKKAAAGVAKGEGYVSKGLKSAGFDNHELYGELGLSLLSYKISRYGISSRPVMLRAIAGYDFHPTWRWKARSAWAWAVAAAWATTAAPTT